MANDVKRYRVTALTPVHIGTGKTLQAGLDFYMEPANQINVIDLDRMLILCAEAGIDPMPYVEEGRFDRLFSRVDSPPGGRQEFDPRMAPLMRLQQRQMTVTPAPASFDPSGAVSYRARLRCRNRPDVLLEQIKTTSSLGYIPGSSIKGAIRTALWAKMLHEMDTRSQVEGKIRQQGERGGREWAGQVGERVAFGKDPNHDLGRTIQVGDTHPGARVSVIEVVIADLNQSGRLLWKNLTSRRIESDPRRATSIFCECLPTGAELDLEVRIDPWLFQQDRLDFARHRYLIDGLEAVCSEWASELIDREILFYRNGGLGVLASFYENRLRPALTNEEGFLLQVGWGTGWTEKTAGHLLDEGLQADLRRWFDLGKLLHAGCGGEVRRRGRGYSCQKCKGRDIPFQNVELVSPFPKTRKVAFENGAPAYPLGWLKFSRV